LRKLREVKSVVARQRLVVLHWMGADGRKVFDGFPSLAVALQAVDHPLCRPALADVGQQRIENGAMCGITRQVVLFARVGVHIKELA